VVTFRLQGDDEANKRLLDAIHHDGRIFPARRPLHTAHGRAVSPQPHAEIDTLIDIPHELAGPR